MAVPQQQPLRIADVFCGIGSFHIAAEELDMRCVWACDSDPHVQKVYQAHFGVLPDGDIQLVDPVKVPDHDILCAGFPCQPFSRMGNKRGTNEERGRVMDYAIDILRVKRPRAFVLENVRGLLTSNGGEDFKRLESMIKEAGYSFKHQLLRCEDFGIPQTRHRVFMVGFRDGYPTGFQYPKPIGKCPTLSQYLGLDVVKPFSNTVRCSGRKSGVDNAKNWSAYRMKDGTVFEYTLEHVTKIQGFPADFNWGGVPDSQKWKMLGNTIPTCLSKAILNAVGRHLLGSPEKPALPLPPAVHPPPARKLIDERLANCAKKTQERKRAAEVTKKKREEEEEEMEEDEEDQDSPPPQSSEEESEASSSSEEEPVAKKPRPSPQTRMQAQSPVRDVAMESAVLQLTVKSGSEFVFTLPKEVKEQSIVLKITH